TPPQPMQTPRNFGGDGPGGLRVDSPMFGGAASPAMKAHPMISDVHRVEPPSLEYQARIAEMNSALAKAYAEQIKPCLDQISKLRGLGFAKELKLPSIVVIGDQSSGKSSVLETISGVSFPRGNGVVTLCPLQLSMRSSDKKWRGTVRYFDAQGKEVHWDIDSPDDVENAIQNAQMRITVALAPLVLKPLVLKPLVLKPLPLVLKPLVLKPLVLKSLGAKAPGVKATGAKVPSAKAPGAGAPLAVLAPLVLAPLVLAPLVLAPLVLAPLVLAPLVLAPLVLAPLMTLEAPDLPNLTLVDLPGIARYSHSDGGSVNLYKLTTDIIKEYIQREETIILTVIPLSADTATMEALQLAKDVDPYGLRTIGVLTFPDLVNKGAEEEKLQIARNITFPLSKGYITVKCRNQEDIKSRKSLREAKVDEMRFFSNDPFFSQLDPSQRGTDTLAKRLSTELLTLIKKFIPEVIKDVQVVRERLTQQLEELGVGPPEDDREKVAMIARMYNDFVRMFSSEADGTAHKFTKDGVKMRNLHQRCRIHWRILGEKAATTAKTLGDDATQLRNSILIFLKEQRGRELPNFQSAYPIVESLIRDKLIKPLKFLTLSCLRDISMEVDITLRDLTDQVFSTYPKLNLFIKEAIQDTKERMHTLAKEDIERQFEQENYIWTNDMLYIGETQSRETIRRLVKSLEMPQTSGVYSFASDFSRKAIELMSIQCSQSGKETRPDFAAWFNENFVSYYTSAPSAPMRESDDPEAELMIEKSLNALHAYVK
uniref:Dynamin-type G domain-containing protein n=1 Tax=Macrostomum lignano TaxID=282301 RepID=A0A1I8FZE6_9PLAT